MKLTVDQLHIALDRRPILREVSLEAAEGDIVGLVGPNGSGNPTPRPVCPLLPQRRDSA